MSPEVCKHVISPGLLNRCSLYCRNDELRPEKCWDSEMVAQLTGIKVPGIPVRVCPNCTGRGRKVPFTAEELAGSYYDRHPRKGRSGHADSDEDIPPDHDDPIEEDGFQVSNDFDASVSTSGSLFLETSRKPDGNSTGAPR